MFPDDRGDLHRPAGQQRRVQKVRDVRRARAPGEVVDRHEAVRLAAAERRLRADDAVVPEIALRAGEPAERPTEELPQAARGVRQLEEALGFAVDLVAAALAETLSSCAANWLLLMPPLSTSCRG